MAALRGSRCGEHEVFVLYNSAAVIGVLFVMPTKLLALVVILDRTPSERERERERGQVRLSRGRENPFLPEALCSA